MSLSKGMKRTRDMVKIHCVLALNVLMKYFTKDNEYMPFKKKKGKYRRGKLLMALLAANSDATILTCQARYVHLCNSGVEVSR